MIYYIVTGAIVAGCVVLAFWIGSITAPIPEDFYEDPPDRP